MGAFGSSSFYGISDPDFSDQYNRWIFQAGQEIKDVKISIESTYQWNFIEYPITAPGPATNCIFRLWVGVGYDRQPLRIFDLVYSGATIPLAANGVTYDEIVSVINYSLGTIYENERVYIVMGVFTDYPVLPSASAPWGMKIIPLNPELSRISIEVAFDSRETLVKGYRWYNMWEKVGSKLFGTKYGSTPFKSIYLSNPSTFVKGNYPYRTILTNGQLVKGAASAKTKISPKDLVEDAMANWPVGVGIIDDVIQIEHLSTFYDTSEVVYDFGELVDFKIESINNVKNTFVIGNKYDTLDTLNGVFDFNTVSTFKNAAILKGEGSTTLKSNFISSIYSIEKLRVAEYGKDITGSNISEDIFKYSVVGYETTLGDITYYGIRYAEVVPDEYYVYGVTWSETKYNVEFSPKNMYERVKWVINTNQKPSVLPFTFQKSDRYGGMYSLFYDTPNGIYFDEVYEDRDIVPNDDDLFFLPFKISGKAPLTTTLENIMTLNKYKMFACRCNGVYIEFFIDKITFTPYSKDTFDIEGRIAPTIDLNTLISL
jgi:hypothetical protein